MNPFLLLCKKSKWQNISISKCEMFLQFERHFQLKLLYGLVPSNSIFLTIANVNIFCHFDCCLNRRNGFWICGNWFLLAFMSRQKSAVLRPSVYKMNALQIPILRWNTCRKIQRLSPYPSVLDILGMTISCETL